MAFAYLGAALFEDVASLLLLIILLMIVGSILKSAIRIVKEYERAVIFRFGRIRGVKGPGIIFVIPIVDRVQIVDLRTTVRDVPEQKSLTKDNIEVTVDAVVYYRVFDPIKAVTQVRDYHTATAMLAMTMLRDIVGQVELDELLAKREEISRRLAQMLDEATDPWGIKVVTVKLKEIKIPASLQRAIAKQAEAERIKRARIIEAEGELRAAELMARAAKVYQEVPEALILRQLQTLVDIAREKNLVVVTTIGGAESRAMSSVLGTVLGIEKGKEERKGTQ